MKLFVPTVGPIVGHTTHNEARLWFRGRFEATQPNGYRRCFGAVRWREQNQNWLGQRVGKLSPNFDMTGVFPLLQLKPFTIYEYQAGWFLVDSELDSVQKIQFEWDALPVQQFRTGVDTINAPQSVVVGSCRYLLKLFGGEIFDDRGDKTFHSILVQHRARPLDAVLMVGDQIYADDLSFVSPDKKLGQFLERYQIVFSQDHIRRLMSEVPTYMILDDHEIEDNWPIKATGKDMTTLYPHAIHAYQIYQCSHSPVFDLDKQGWVAGTPTHFWYTFSQGCADWFVMDTRTERLWHPDETRRQMIKSTQMTALLQWLADGSGRVKMVVSSVPFIPDLQNDADDKWGAYRAERSQILDFILESQIRRVVFVSGDVHCSFTTEINSPDDPQFKVHGIVSSSLFWPYPHMEQNDFIFKGELGTAGKYRYLMGKSSKVQSLDNFARLDIDPSSVRVTYHERKGKVLGKPVTLTL
ncbi:MAG TPA: alkaline phosphatase D family protein [Dongiaceae bacterium]|nr:alkaline phosphatase D family protein [Dongiaceae bacterium]